jgi:hypothetical protein
MSEAPNDLVADYLQARMERDKAQAHLDETQARLIKQMEADQRKTYRWQAGGRQHHLTYVQQHTTEIDEKGLRKALTAKVFDKYTQRKLNRKWMEIAMDAGEVDPVVVSKYVSQKPKRPFLTYTDKVVED